MSSHVRLTSHKHGHQEDRAAIRTLISRWRDGWNRHDTRTLASIFAPDAVFVTVKGLQLKGRAEFRKFHETMHQTMFRGSIWRGISADIRFVDPRIALVHIDWAIKGDTNLDGTAREPRNGIMTWILRKRGRTWSIDSAQNTNINIGNMPSLRGGG